MAINIYIDKVGHSALEKWTPTHKDTVLYYARDEFRFFNKFVLIFENAYKAFCEVKKQGYKINIVNEEGTAIKLFVEFDKSEKNDFNIKYKLLKPLEYEVLNEIVNTVITVASDVNALFFELQILNRKVDLYSKDQNWLIRELNNKPILVPVGSHLSPEGVFGVKGHLRHYKSGKTVWIDDYVKGADKK